MIQENAMSTPCKRGLPALAASAIAVLGLLGAGDPMAVAGAVPGARAR